MARRERGRERSDSAPEGPPGERIDYREIERRGGGRSTRCRQGRKKMSLRRTLVVARVFPSPGARVTASSLESRFLPEEPPCARLLVRRVSSATLAVSFSLSLFLSHSALPSCSSFNGAFNVRAHVLSYTAYTSRFFARANGAFAREGVSPTETSRRGGDATAGKGVLAERRAGRARAREKERE